MYGDTANLLARQCAIVSGIPWKSGALARYGFPDAALKGRSFTMGAIAGEIFKQLKVLMLRRAWLHIRSRRHVRRLRHMCHFAFLCVRHDDACVIE
jgi:hypothetical protein